jgi:hypothetical protein
MIGKSMSKETSSNLNDSSESTHFNLDSLREKFADKKSTPPNPQLIRRLLNLLTSYESKLKPIFGSEFFDIIRMAPWEYAFFTLIGHLLIVFPDILLKVHSDKIEVKSPKENKKHKLFRKFYKTIMPFYDSAYHQALAPTLISTNHTECEFKGLKCPSWHGLVYLYAEKAIHAIETGIETGSLEFEKMKKNPQVEKIIQKEIQREKIRIRKKGRKPNDLLIQKYFHNTFRLFSEINEAIHNLENQGLETTEDDLRWLCIHLQQELPRAWAFKYGPGNTDFYKFDEADILVLESCVIPGRAVGPRNATFMKWHKEEGLGANRISKKWNAMSENERRQIAPKAFGKVTHSAVKKVLQRDQPNKN